MVKDTNSTLYPPIIPLNFLNLRTVIKPVIHESFNN
jgi:hypothetical protein